ncbi:MAG: hypothetical protein ACXQTS_06885 [Candidatus Methanospirareceae archaeon]
MGWIKVKVSDEVHWRLRERAAKEKKEFGEYIREILEKAAKMPP